ncbi:STAS domain-containing protein [Sorangium sp. So ce327]|jgi:rsbT co-antagonist protein RsbR|uniref:STAS domain-containing protein n=1 Tax=unclassified Sorangium TaxID=2621164 RepID=UPI003F5ECA6A
MDEAAHETIAELRRAHEEERALRLEAEGLAEVLLRFTEPGSFTETLARVVEATAQRLGAAAGLVIAFDEGADGRALVATDPGLSATEWEAGPAFSRALEGRPVASFDLRQLAEWQRQPEPVLARYGSALHAPLHAGPLRSLLVLVHPDRAFFDARHVSLVRRLLPAASQALARARAEEELARARDLAYEREITEKLTLIEHQRAAIRALSMPIIEVWSRILCVPVIGFVDEERCALLMERLLSAVTARRARAVVIDVTGLDRMEASALALFLRVATAVRLLGSTCVLAGIGPEVARDLVREGVARGDVVTYRRLHDALRELLPPSKR